jgi:hypothetical protein
LAGIPGLLLRVYSGGGNADASGCYSRLVLTNLYEPVMRVMNLMKADGIQGITSAVIMHCHTHHRFRQSFKLTKT